MKTGMAKTLLIGVIALSLCITRRREGNGIYEPTYSPFIIITDIMSNLCITGFALTENPLTPWLLLARPLCPLTYLIWQPFVLPPPPNDRRVLQSGLYRANRWRAILSLENTGRVLLWRWSSTRSHCRSLVAHNGSLIRCSHILTSVFKPFKGNYPDSHGPRIF